MPQRCVFALAATFVGVLAVAGPAAGAAARITGGADSLVEEALKLYHFVLSERAPSLFDPLIDVEQAAALPVCDPRRSPVTHAILIGASVPGGEIDSKYNLPGSANDVEMFSGLLVDRGAAPARIHRLSGEEADRGAVSAAMEQVLRDVGCDDRVVFSFSGHAHPSKTFVRGLYKRAKDLVHQSTWARFFASEEKIDSNVNAMKRVAASLEGEAAARWSDLSRVEEDEIVFMVFRPENKGFAVFLGRDISDFMIAVRNKGAHAVALLDSNSVALSRIEDRQRRADTSSLWTYQYDPRGARESKATGPTLVAGHGSYTLLYAAGPAENTPEMPLPRGVANARKYGLFSFVVGAELLENVSATPRSIAGAIQGYYLSSKRSRPSPIVETSAPDLVLVAEAAPRREDPIRIISPAPQRGAAKMDKAEIEIEGLVDWPAPVLGVFVGSADATLEAGGRFRHTVTLKSGLNVIDVRAVTADNRMLSRKLELLFEGDRQALVGEGRRYAVVIANQTYGGATGMPSLSTPFADADAISAVLTERYGFVTDLPLGEGRTLPLVLRDPTKRDIQAALHQLGKVAGSKDTVLVFYAGHGVFEKVTSTAYWVPSDAEKGFEPSYLSADDISAAIQRMQAGKVILISDSCYSGALMRGGPEDEPEPIEDDERIELLLKLQSSRSRIVISSGNNEPVSDGGGEGHSVFARALLTGLEKMEYDAFSARELFDDFILKAVAGNADQEPQYRPLERVGHEGGDFVFVKVAAQAAP
ncbi:MAG: caspase family protein [Rhizobiaceae bacterium]